MADVIANNLPQFQGDIDAYENAEKELSGAFDSMVNNMNQLNTMWEGEALETFKETFARDVVKVNSMLQYLVNVHKELVFAHTEYTECEKNVANIIDQL